MHAFYTLINAINFDNIVLSLLIKMYINKYIFFRCNGHFFFSLFAALCWHVTQIVRRSILFARLPALVVVCSCCIIYPIIIFPDTRCSRCRFSFLFLLSLSSTGFVCLPSAHCPYVCVCVCPFKYCCDPSIWCCQFSWKFIVCCFPNLTLSCSSLAISGWIVMY